MEAVELSHISEGNTFTMTVYSCRLDKFQLLRELLDWGVREVCDICASQMHGLNTDVSIWYQKILIIC